MANRADSLRKRDPRVYLAIIALVILQSVWLVWFLAEPLPSVPASMGGGKVQRWMFLARALPEIIPDVRFSQSYLGMALDELRHVEYLPQRVPILLAATLIAGAAISLGQSLLRLLRLRSVLTRAERLAVSYGLGCTGLGILMLFVGRLGLLSPWLMRSGLGALMLIELGLKARDWRSSKGVANPHDPKPNATPLSLVISRVVSFAVVAGPFVILMLLGAMLPTIDFDAIEYHVQGPKEYFQAGRISFLPHNVYTSMPFSVEMLHLLGMEVLNDWWWGALVGQVMIALYAPAAAAMVAIVAARWGSPRAAWIAAIVYLSTPWIYRLGVLPYVEGPLCYYHAALIWAASRAWGFAEPRLRDRAWVVVGLFAGGAMACKYPALVSAVVPFWLVALAASIKVRSPRVVLAFILGWGVVMAPWLVKNVIDTGNPVYPLGYRVFGGSHWSPELDAKWSKAHGPRAILLTALGSSLVDVAGRSDWQSPLYLALAPLAFLRTGTRRESLLLWGFVLYLFATWWLLTHRLDRFWLPLLPPLAMLAGFGADWVRSRVWTTCLGFIMGLAIISNLAYSSTALVGLNEWTGDLVHLRTDIPRRLNPPLARLGESLPPNSKVLLVGQAAVFHLDRPIVFNTVFNEETIETLTRDKSPGEVRKALTERGITHVYIDWFEVNRYRSPENYGFTDYVTPQLFAKFVADGILEPLEPLGSKQDLYKVR
ncbi:ArnT family glycosyltransferase [Singulisphaera sp. PoT]|uniref:ArnT family glycosyltransferase n=1 Tax=Singulisphaera sp. PoT TaxID=3411797 RepID=UPI003BF5679E